MRKLVLALLAFVAVSCATYAVAAQPFPLTTIGTVDGAVMGVAYNPCGEGGSLGESSAIRLAVVLPSGEYLLTLYMREAKPTRFLLVDNADGDETPVWVGTVDEAGNFRVHQTMTYKDLVSKYATICDVLARQQV